jgi:anti-sigma B factor antagonist
VDFKLETKEVKSVPILKLQGEMDVYTAPRVRSRLVDLVDQGKHNIIVDLQKVDFLDSSGLGVLVGGLKRVKPHKGSIVLIINEEKILKIFKITGLTKVFPIFDTEKKALASITD